MFYLVNKYFLLIATSLILFAGCGGPMGEDGKDGKVLYSFLFTSRIKAIDLSNIIMGGENPETIRSSGGYDYFGNYKSYYYEMTPGKTGDVYWLYNSTVNYSTVTVPNAPKGGKGEKAKITLTKSAGKDGKDSRDDHYSVILFENTWKIRGPYNYIISGKYNNTNTALGKRLEKNEEDIEGYFIKGNSKIP